MPGTSFRRAVAASVAIHVGLGVGLVVLGRWAATRPEPARPVAFDTRVAERVAIHFADERAIEVTPPAATPASDDTTPPVRPEPEEPTGARPEVFPVPRSLPAEVFTLLKRPPEPVAPAVPAVVEVPVTPTPLEPARGAHATPHDSARIADATPIQPARGADAAPLANARGADATPLVPPLHGALTPGQTIVYVLDASGSMGEWGKFEAARRAVIATLRRQPEGVRFQVVVYAGLAQALLPAPVSGCVPTTADNVDRIEKALAALPPAGRSNHAEGLRAALALRPDFVLMITDATDLSAEKFRGVFAQAPKLPVVCVATVTADGVGPPARIK